MKEQTTRRAWRVASEIVSSRPWLDISWVGDGEGHLVVHDGPFGAALHFDDDEGATWEPRSAPVRELAWEDITEGGSVRLLGATDWRECWGETGAAPQITGKTATYTLIAEILHGDGDGALWSARPAKLVLETDENLVGPESAFSLINDFPSLGSVVGWYVDQISSASWGEGTFWHEPLWVVSQDGLPQVVLDEAGDVHLSAGSLVESLAVLAVATDFGGIDEPRSFEVLDALARVDGSFSALAGHLRRGPAATLRAIKHDRTADPDRQ